LQNQVALTVHKPCKHAFANDYMEVRSLGTCVEKLLHQEKFIAS